LTPHRRKRRDPRTLVLYTASLVREFRVTLLALAGVLLLGTVLYHAAPAGALEGERPSLSLSLYASWMALFGEPVFSRPAVWTLQLVNAAYPVLGIALIGEGIVRFALLMISRRHGEKEWTLVMASTYRDHVILCGLGHLGYRVLEELLAQGRQVVVIEKDAGGRFVPAAKAAGVAVLPRDMTDDAALVDAGIANAAAIILCTSDDLANLEAAMDARRMKPTIRIAVRLFDSRLASKLREAVAFDAPFSSSALAAPAVAAMTLGTRVVASSMIAGKPHVAAELTAERRSPVVGTTVAGLESERGVRVLGRKTRRGELELPPAGSAVIDDEDELTVHVAAARLGEVSALFRGGASTPARS
jgi:Trk K+ transport system NAD-binding subunit